MICGATAVGEGFFFLERLLSGRYFARKFSFLIHHFLVFIGSLVHFLESPAGIYSQLLMTFTASHQYLLWCFQNLILFCIGSIGPTKPLSNSITSIYNCSPNPEVQFNKFNNLSNHKYFQNKQTLKIVPYSTLH